MGQLDQVDVPGQKPLQRGIHGQSRHIPRRDVEQHAQGQGAGSGFGQLDRAEGLRPQLRGQLGLQGLPAQQGDQLVQPHPGGQEPGQQGGELPGLQPFAQGVHGADHRLRLQGRGGADGVQLGLQAVQHGFPFRVRQQRSVGEDQKASPFPKSSAAPAAQVWMSPMPTRPRMVR